MNDDELVRRFDSGTLTAFPHELHVRLTQAKLARMPEADALESIRRGIRAMAAAAGAPQKYHETRTGAWFRLIAAGLPDEQLMRRDLLDDYYSPALLNSDGARAAFVEPDLRPLVEPPSATT